MNVTRWKQLEEVTHRSYRVQIDLRELKELTDAALNLRMLVDAVRLLADKVTIEDERARFIELVKDIPVLEGDLP